MYEPFAPDFDRTRSQPWAPLLKFLEKIEFGSLIGQGDLVLDAGSGNGRHLTLPEFQEFQNFVVGADTSFQLLKMARKKPAPAKMKRKLHMVQADILALPFRSQVFDINLNIAVLHHIPSFKARANGLGEILRVVRGGGYIIGSLWRLWQKRFRIHFQEELLKHWQGNPEHETEFGDIDIGWKEASTGNTYPRFYHLFTGLEFLRLVRAQRQQIERKNAKLLGGANKRDNIFFLLKKLTGDTRLK